MKKIIIPISIAIIVVVFAIAGYADYQNKLNNQKQKPMACTTEAKICPDGSSVGRVSPSCEFAPCPDWKIFNNTEYGFQITFSDSWKGYKVDINSWKGSDLSGGNKKYSGPEFIFNNPQGPNNHDGNVESCWQNIPIMVFTPDIWQLVNEEKIDVSAAPIGPTKIGENSKYVFALPPRWSGFVCDIGIGEAQNIVKTFKAF